MSVGTKLLQAAAGNAGETVYVDDVFSTNLWNGNGGTQSIVNGIDLSGEGGLTWIKYRDQSLSHHLTDTARGTNSQLSSDSTGAAGASTVRVTAFNNNGFTLGANTGVNGSNGTYVGWTFRKQRKFFDIVTYTGNGTAGRTISHNLGSVPGMIIVKRTDATQDWVVFHRSLSANTKSLFLHSNSAELSYSWLNSTDPTSTVVTLGDRADVNASSGTYVMYLFAHNNGDGVFGESGNEDIIKCGSFTAGTFYGNTGDLGFEPQWFLVKEASGQSDWIIVDNMRGLLTAATDAQGLDANNSNAEETVNVVYDTNDTSVGTNGIRNFGGDSDPNETYIYVAIARPNKPASEFAATDLFGIDTLGSTGDGAEPGFRSTFPCDTGIRLDTSAASTEITSRLTQGTWMYTDQNSVEATANFAQFDYSNGWGASTSTASNYYGYMFRRARGFFDVLVYKGNGTAGRTLPHNLGVTPEIIIFKNRGNNNRWTVWFSSFGTDEYIFLNENFAKNHFGIGTGDYYLNDTSPTSSVITIGSDTAVNSSSAYQYIIYLFASADGISKVGSYTGTGSDLNVDCGFSAGARFVLIKRTDSTGDWYLYDSSRGIVAGNDPYKFLNSNAASVTNTDYIDPLNAGFTITSSAPAGLNASSGTYIFLAIAQELTWQNTETGQAAK